MKRARQARLLAMLTCCALVMIAVVGVVSVTPMARAAPMPVQVPSAAPLSCLSVWQDLPGSARTYAEPARGLQSLTVAVQTACGGAYARTRISLQAERERGYRGTLAVAVCTAHARDPLAYCDPALNWRPVSVRLAPGGRGTRYSPRAWLAPQQRPGAPCDLSWGVPLGTATADTVTLVWSWQSRVVCGEGMREERSS